MSESYRFDLVDDFVPGAVGPPGHRAFYLQVDVGTDHLTFRCEKAQVAALAASLERILEDLPISAATPGPVGGLDDTDAAEWVVAGIGLAFDPEADRLVVQLEELLPDDEADPDPTPATARFAITRGVAAAFTRRAGSLVSAGRPPCTWCGRPLDPEGHACPRMN